MMAPNSRQILVGGRVTNTTEEANYHRGRFLRRNCALVPILKTLGGRTHSEDDDKRPADR